jgi:hypothetical protein
VGKAVTIIKFDDETTDYLRELGSQSDDYESKMADAAVQLADVLLRETEGGKRYYYDEHGERHPAQVLWNAISDATNKWAPDTVRTQERYGRLIPRRIRDEYDMFTWSHHKAVFDGVGSDIEKHTNELDYWIEQAHEYGGNIAPVRVVSAYYRADGTPSWVKTAEKLLRAAEALLDTDCPPEYERIAGIVVDMWPNEPTTSS